MAKDTIAMNLKKLLPGHKVRSLSPDVVRIEITPFWSMSVIETKLNGAYSCSFHQGICVPPDKLKAIIDALSDAIATQESRERLSDDTQVG